MRSNARFRQIPLVLLIFLMCKFEGKWKVHFKKDTPAVLYKHIAVSMSTLGSH